MSRCPICGEVVASLSVRLPASDRLTEHRIGRASEYVPLPNPTAEPCGHEVLVTMEHGAVHIEAPQVAPR